MNFKAAQAEWERYAVWVTALELVALIVFLFLLYVVIKSAIRDGIRDSGLLDEIRAARRPVEVSKLPPMTADR